jgi:hypothetical protein
MVSNLSFKWGASRPDNVVNATLFIQIDLSMPSPTVVNSGELKLKGVGALVDLGSINMNHVIVTRIHLAWAAEDNVVNLVENLTCGHSNRGRYSEDSAIQEPRTFFKN